MAPGIALKSPFADIAPKKLKKLAKQAEEAEADASPKIKKKKKREQAPEDEEQTAEEVGPTEEVKEKKEKKEKKKDKKRKLAEVEDADDSAEAEEPPQKAAKASRMSDAEYRKMCARRRQSRSEPASVFAPDQPACAAPASGLGERRRFSPVPPLTPLAARPPPLTACRHSIVVPPDCGKMIQTFDEAEFPPALVAALKSQGFDAPTPIQARAKSCR